MKKLLAIAMTISMVLSFAVIPAKAATFSSANKVRYEWNDLTMGSGDTTKSDETLVDDGNGGQWRRQLKVTGGSSKTLSSNRYPLKYVPEKRGSNPKYSHLRLLVGVYEDSDRTAMDKMMIVRFTKSDASSMSDSFAVRQNGRAFPDGAGDLIIENYNTDFWSFRSSKDADEWHTIDVVCDHQGLTNNIDTGVTYMFIDGKYVGSRYDSSKAAALSEAFYGIGFKWESGKSINTNSTIEAKFEEGREGHTEYYDTDDYKVCLEDVLNDAGLGAAITSKMIYKTSNLDWYMPGSNQDREMYYTTSGDSNTSRKVNADVTYEGTAATVSHTQSNTDSWEDAADMLAFYPYAVKNGRKTGISYAKYQPRAKYVKISFDQTIKSSSSTWLAYDLYYSGSVNALQMWNDDGNTVVSVKGSGENSTLDGSSGKPKALINGTNHFDWILEFHVDESDEGVNGGIIQYLFCEGILVGQGKIGNNNLNRINNIKIQTKGDENPEITIDNWSMTLYNDTMTMDDFENEIEEWKELKYGKLLKIENYQNNIKYFCNMDKYNALSNKGIVLDIVAELIADKGITLSNGDYDSCTAIEDAFKMAILIESLNEKLVTDIWDVKSGTMGVFDFDISASKIDNLNTYGKNRLIKLLTNRGFSNAAGYRTEFEKSLFVNSLVNPSDTFADAGRETFFDNYYASVAYDVTVSGISDFCNTESGDALSDKSKVSVYANEILAGETKSNNYAYLCKVEQAVASAILIQSLNENKITDIETVKLNTNSNIGMSYIDSLTSLGKTELLAALSGQNFETVENFQAKLEKAIFLNVMLNSTDSVDTDSFFSDNIYKAAFSVDDQISDFFADPSDDVVNTINGLTKTHFGSVATLSKLADIIMGKKISTTTKKSYFDAYAAGLGLTLTSYNALAKDTLRETVISKLATSELTDSNFQTLLDSFVSQAAASEVVNPAQNNGVPSSNSSNNSGSGVTLTGGSIPVPQNSTIFTDMASYSWATNAVAALKQKGIISGYADNKFMPQNSVTRAEFIAMMVRAYIPNATAAGGKFGDISENDWFYNSVMVAFEKGIVSGVTDTEFMPNKEIKRQDIAVILYNLASKLGKGIGGENGDFVDGDAVSDYAKTAVSFLKSAGVVKGDETGAFNPQNFANRAEAAQMIYTFMQRIGEGVLR